jgi:hypothetical protein
MRGGLRRRLHGAQRHGRVHVPAVPPRAAYKPREERHGKNDRQGSEKDTAEDTHASEHIGLRRTSPSR